MGIVNKLQKLFQKNIVRFSAPFLLCIIGGSFYLKEFADLRYKYNRKSTQILKEEASLMGFDCKKRVTLEEEYEKLKEKDLDNWENKRIPRPWEETPQAS